MLPAPLTFAGSLARRSETGVVRMFDNLFGAEMPLAVRFFLAFLIVLGLIGVTAWAVRRFGAGRLGGASARGRQPRLAVIDYASVDGRRRLVLVRRDNVEHLLMIGGPSDVVVEPNIVRAVAAPRDVPGARPTAGIEALPRAIPLPDNGNGSWPLAPEPAGALRAPRIEPEELPRQLPAAEPPPRPQRDTLSALADELSVRHPPPRRSPAARPLPQEPPVEHRAESRPEPRIEPRAEPRAEPRVEPSAEPRTEPRKPMTQPAAAAPAMPPAPPAPPIAGAPAAGAAATPDQNLADMAQRLEAALRKPGAEARQPATPARAAPAAETKPRPDAKDAKDAKAKESKTPLYDTLEQEMANLLGRPNKT